jgi:hypothetical protein
LRHIFDYYKEICKKKESSVLSSLERFLFPLKHALLLNVMDPLQWFYVEPMVCALNRSVVVLCHFNLREAGIQMPGGAHAIEFANMDVNSIFGNDWQSEDNLSIFANIFSSYLEVLQPTGFVLCGHSEKEQQMADLARSSGIRVVYLAQGCSSENIFPHIDSSLWWRLPYGLAEAYGKRQKRKELL